MEEESEKKLLPEQESIEVKKDEEAEATTITEKDANAESTLIPIEEKKDEKRNKFFSLFEWKKNNSSDSNEEAEAKNESSSFSFRKIFKKDANDEPNQSDSNNQCEQKGIFAGFLDKFRRGRYDVAENIELGNEPKAGLASMETLDDSTKDPWTENGNGISDSKAIPEKTPESEQKEKDAADGVPVKESLWSSIQSYECSVDDVALCGGIITFIFLVLLILLFTFTASPKHAISAPVKDGRVLATTSCGTVEGLMEEHAAIAFRGIPYAKPPLGERRFSFAEPIDDIEYCWNGTLQAHNATPACLQSNSDGSISGDENCLTLDIITPEVKYINLLPVIVQIGSDNYVNGSPSILRPSSKYARSKSVIFVRPNFRLNVFGFLALESISNSSNIPSSGNYALSDIIAALEWINLNIHHFGGDKNAITLFGYRVGASLVTALSASPKANKLFARAWASSGSYRFPGNELKDSERNNIEYANAFPDCTTKSCWQQKNSSELLSKIPASWGKRMDSLPASDEKFSDYHEWIVLDGIILKQHIEDMWKSAKSLPKIVIGTTAHSMFDYNDQSIFSKNFTEEEIEKYVNDSRIGSMNLTDEAFKLYPKTKEGLISMISDIRRVCPLLVQARSQPNIAFYVVTQPQGDENLVSVDADILAILGRYNANTTEKRRYLDAMGKLFYYYVYHGKINHNLQNNILEIEQDVYLKNNYKNCDFWISNNLVPHYAAYY